MLRSLKPHTRRFPCLKTFDHIYSIGFACNTLFIYKPTATTSLVLFCTQKRLYHHLFPVIATNILNSSSVNLIHPLPPVWPTVSERGAGSSHHQFSLLGGREKTPNTILSTVLAVLAVILQDARAQRKHSKGTRLVLCLQVERPIFYRSMVICRSHLENDFWKTNSRYPESFSETEEFEVSDLGMFLMLLAFCLHTNLLGMEEHAHS